MAKLMIATFFLLHCLCFIYVRSRIRRWSALRKDLSSLSSHEATFLHYGSYPLRQCALAENAAQGNDDIQRLPITTVMKRMHPLSFHLHPTSLTEPCLNPTILGACHYFSFYYCTRYRCTSVSQWFLTTLFWLAFFRSTAFFSFHTCLLFLISLFSYKWSSLMHCAYFCVS